APQSTVYGAAVPPLPSTATGFVNGDTPATALSGSLATTATASSGVGSYPITQGTIAAANYAITFTGNTLTVTPALLTVTADDLTVPAGHPLPPLTYSVAGLVNGGTPAVVARGPLATAPPAHAPPGQSPITATGGQAANYTVSDRSGTLILTPSAEVHGFTDFATGADAGGAPLATLYNPEGSVRFSRTAFDPSFTGGVRVA